MAQFDVTLTERREVQVSDEDIFNYLQSRILGYNLNGRILKEDGYIYHWEMTCYHRNDYDYVKERLPTDDEIEKYRLVAELKPYLVRDKV